MISITPFISEFTAIGELEDLALKSDGRIKYLLLSTEQEEYEIKVAKDQPKNLAKQMKPGCKLEIKGLIKHSSKHKRGEYKAHSIKLLNSEKIQPQPQTEAIKIKSSKSKPNKTKVLICQKSNCWKKGGKKVYQQLEKELEQLGIKEQVEIKMTGCLKKCKKAPNIVVLPDKKQYVRVKPKQISTIVNQHFSQII